MTNTQDRAEIRFREYLGRLAAAVGHKVRSEPLRAYITGLCLPGDRKSIEPMAARVDPRHVRACHQSMHHFVAQAPWDDAAVLKEARNQVLDQMERHGAVTAWVVDDTGFPKKGTHSVGVARQYCGLLGKQDNCQVAVSLTVANEAVSIPVAYRLYLPKPWAEDPKRRKAVGVPEETGFLTKWEIALEQIAHLQNEEGLPVAPILADAGYGMVTEFRTRLTEMNTPYSLGVPGETTVWGTGEQPLPPRRHSGGGRPATLLRRTKKHHPISILKLALELPGAAWQTVSWRQGTKGTMYSRFAYSRVRPAHRDQNLHEPRPPEWLLIEWPKEETQPTKYWLSTMPEGTQLSELVRLTKIRWRIERDYEELKSEFGLDHFEGRSWRGFHHHGTLCIAAYAFLAAERARLSPPEPLSFLSPPSLPRGFKPRGAPSPSRAARTHIDHHAEAHPITRRSPVSTLPRLWPSSPSGQR